MKLKHVPNALCIVRLAMIPVLWAVALLIPDARVLFAGLLGLAYFTDCMDGYLCRRYGLATPLGAKLDRWADDLLIANTAIWLWVLEPDLYLVYWPVVGGLLAAMALSIALQFRRFGRKIPFHLTAGKTTNWVIPIFTMVTVLYGPMWWAVAILGTVGGYAVVEELILILTREDLDEHVTSMFSKRRRNAVD